MLNQAKTTDRRRPRFQKALRPQKEPRTSSSGCRARGDIIAGRRLIEAGALPPQIVREAFAIARRQNKALCQVLVELRFLAPKQARRLQSQARAALREL